MSSIIEIIKNSSNALGPISSHKVIIDLVDNSGSTGNPFKSGVTVLDKELEVLSVCILGNSNEEHYLCTFETTFKFYGKINVLRSENLVSLPNIRPEGGTNTHLPLQDISDKLVSMVPRPNFIRIITDGQTNSRPADFSSILNNFKKYGVKLEIIAIATSDLDMAKITVNEQQIPGMDLVNMLGNSIDSLTIYSRHHCDIPYSGAVSSSIDKNALTFMGVPFTGLIPEHISKIIAEVEKNKATLDWGLDQKFLKEFIIEVGKLLSVLFINFPENMIFITNIIQQISGFSDFTEERVFNIMKYGFDCTKNKKPILLTNFDEHVKASVVKKGEFADAVSQLRSQGTTLGCFKRICLPINGVCVLDNGSLELFGALGQNPNSMDRFGNAYFSADANPQATRIAIRELCHTLRVQDARNSPSIIFYVANHMALMFIKGTSMDTEHMIELRKIAIVQASMEVLVSNGQYDGIGCFRHWQNGNRIAINFKNPSKTHSSLFTDSLINPLRLSEPTWWALMMSMFGIFNEQMNEYEEPLKQLLGDEITEDKFLGYIRDQYKDSVSGNIIIETFEESKNSIFTLEPFQTRDRVFKLKNHNGCTTCTWYSEGSEMDYVMQRGCLWCHFRPTLDMFELVNASDNIGSLSNSMSLARPLNVSVTTPTVFSQLVQPSSSNKKRFNLMGITGNGKTTTRKIMVDYLTSLGFETLVISADDLSKAGFKGKGMNQEVKKKISAFEKKPGQLAIIVDICNEKRPDDRCFDSDLSQYKAFNYIPNFIKDVDNFDELECWVLRNVLSRGPDFQNSDYWLNPCSASVEICINVHNMKAAGIKSQLGIAGPPLNFDKKLSMHAIRDLIEDRANAHATRLATRDMVGDIQRFIDSCLDN